MNTPSPLNVTLISILSVWYVTNPSPPPQKCDIIYVWPLWYPVDSYLETTSLWSYWLMKIHKSLIHFRIPHLSPILICLPNYLFKKFGKLSFQNSHSKPQKLSQENSQSWNRNQQNQVFKILNWKIQNNLIFRETWLATNQKYKKEEISSSWENPLALKPVHTRKWVGGL